MLRNKIIEIAHHRNGVGGTPFYAVCFTSFDDEFPEEFQNPERLIGIVFPEIGCCSVLNTKLLSSATPVAFGYNSYRGDIFESFLREEIRKKYPGHFD